MRTIVLGDVHLARATPQSVSRDFAALLSDHPGARFVVCGDLFDLSADHPASSIETALGAHPCVREALALHLEKGGELWLAAGNHDALIGSDGFERNLASALSLRETRGIRTSPWFFRLGGVHIEHGHLFDPDNAPSHPLHIEGASLGVHFVRQFIAKTGAHVYLNRNDEKPLKLFISTFAMFGPRAPVIVYRYFRTAFEALAMSGPFYERAEPKTFDAELSREEIARLEALLPEPTLASFTRTFARLYLDRVAATLALAGGATMFAMGQRRAGSTVAALGALGMLVSWGFAHDRYGGAAHDRLRKGAADLRAATNADLVVFGHTHRTVDDPHYRNTGSFAFPANGDGRPFLELESGVAKRRFHQRRDAY